MKKIVGRKYKVKVTPTSLAAGSVATAHQLRYEDGVEAASDREDVDHRRQLVGDLEGVAQESGAQRRDDQR
jgi:hypothetical protein